MILATEVPADWFRQGIIRYYRFPLKSDYHAYVSYAAFYSGTNRRCVKPDGTTYVCCREEDKIWISPKAEIIDVSSLWEFYKAIGYDHKRNKYTKD